MEESRRERAALTAGAEKRVLEAIARRLPAWIHSDHLTFIGVIGGLGTAAGYVLAALSPLWLWLSSAMLVVNWFGDSLDGSLARTRNVQRPRYGYYLDHAVDAFMTAILGIGIGLSPYVPLYAGLGVVLLYLMLSINVYLESKVYNVFRMDYGPVGPTEARLVLIAGNTLLIWGASRGWRPEQIEPIGAMVAGGLAGLMTLALLVRFAQNLRRLGREDPLRPPGIRQPDGEPAPQRRRRTEPVAEAASRDRETNGDHDTASNRTRRRSWSWTP